MSDSESQVCSRSGSATVLEHGHRIEQSAALKKHADSLAHPEELPLRELCDLLAGHPDAAPVRPGQAGHQAQEGAFPLTAAAHQDRDRAPLELTAEPAEDRAASECQMYVF